jgi:ferredoxin
MKVIVDLNKCQDHGQCVYSAPKLFSLDEYGRLSLRHLAKDRYVSDDLDESLWEDAEEAADVCPLQAIDIQE